MMVAINKDTGSLVPTSTNATLHWVVIVATSPNYVTILNPFTNRPERYLWTIFEESFSGQYIEIAPPPGYINPEPERECEKCA
jgi:ABC-type bacteriocin/lantibiotic exporter with double-glycine peptidase domain